MSSTTIATFGDLERYGREAQAYAQEYGFSGPHNGDADAFRHAYASAEMTRQYNETFARGAGSSWEVFGAITHGPSSSETNMDLWNNARGREMGRDSTSSRESAERARDAVRDGRLITDPDDTRNRYYDDYATSPPNPMLGLPGFIANNIDAIVNGSFIAARNLVIRRDPLVLDLDGDGLELIGASGAVLFDHNADGIKTGTGWARPDDGFLVRDLDGNGTIDTGREVFGVDTFKNNGGLATDGFDALRELDSNNDGAITNLDAAFAELKVWRDLDQNGISTANELFTLDQLNITSINTNGTSTGPQAGQVINNHRVALSTTFTQNGQTRKVGAIDLEANNFFTQFPTFTKLRAASA